MGWIAGNRSTKDSIPWVVFQVFDSESHSGIWRYLDR